MVCVGCHIYHHSNLHMYCSASLCADVSLLVGVNVFCYLLCCSLCFTFFGNEWPKSSVAQTVFVYLYNWCQGDIYSSSNGLIVSFPTRGEAWDRGLWLLFVFTMERFVGLCCMPLTTQRSSVGLHRMPLNTLKNCVHSLDLFLEHSSDSWLVWTRATYTWM